MAICVCICVTVIIVALIAAWCRRMEYLGEESFAEEMMFCQRIQKLERASAEHGSLLAELRSGPAHPLQQEGAVAACAPRGGVRQA